MGKQQEQTSRVAAVKDAALRDLISVVGCLEAWSAPIREAHIRATSTTTGGGVGGGGGADDSAEENGGGLGGAGLGAIGGLMFNAPPPSMMGPPGGGGGPAVGGEAERFEAVHSHKTLMAKAIAMFNSSPMKGIRFLIQQGLIPALPPPVGTTASASSASASPSRTPAEVAAFLYEHRAEVDKVSHMWRTLPSVPI